jgi:hypothetical protein
MGFRLYKWEISEIIREDNKRVPSAHNLTCDSLGTKNITLRVRRRLGLTPTCMR